MTTLFTTIDKQSPCERCLPEAAIQAIQSAFETTSFSRIYNDSFDLEDYNMHIATSFAEFVKTVSTVKNSRKISQLVSSLLFPLGYPYYMRSDNENGKIVLRLLIECSLLIAPLDIDTPNGLNCENTVYKLHLASAHLKQQPSADGGTCMQHTRDSLVCVVTTEKTIDMPRFYQAFYDLPCILIADTDTSKTYLEKQMKISQFKEDMKSYRRDCKIPSFGLFFNDRIIKVFLYDEQTMKTTMIKQFNLSNPVALLDLIRLLNKFLHYVAARLVPVSKEKIKLVTKIDDKESNDEIEYDNGIEAEIEDINDEEDEMGDGIENSPNDQSQQVSKDTPTPRVTRRKQRQRITCRKPRKSIAYKAPSEKNK